LIESIAGAIYVDSNHDKVVVWRAMRRLLEPLATVTSLEPDPVSELKELCEGRKYPQPLYSSTRDDGARLTTVVVQVTAAGTLYLETGKGRNEDVATALAAKALLQKLKAAAAVS
jgi:endoribonuclease Dicer